MGGYESDFEPEAAELTFFSCYDNLNDFPDFKLDPEETIWIPKLGTKETSSEKNGKSSSKIEKFLSDDDSDCLITKNDDDDFEDSPLALRERLLLRKVSKNEKVLKTPSLYDKRYRTMRESICPKPRRYTLNSEGEEETEIKLPEKSDIGDEIEIITILDDSVDPVFNSTNLDTKSPLKCALRPIENLTLSQQKSDSKSLSGKQRHFHKSKTKCFADVTKHSSVQRRIFAKNTEKKNLGNVASDDDFLGSKNFRGREQSNQLLSSTDEEDADDALEAFFKRMQSPKGVQSVGDNLYATSSSTRKTSKSRKPKGTAASTKTQRTKSHEELTSKALKYPHNHEFIRRSKSRCSTSQADEDVFDAKKIKKLSAKLSSDSEDAKEIDNMSLRLIQAVGTSFLPKKEVDLADELNTLSIDSPGQSSPSKKDYPRKKYPQTPASGTRDGKSKVGKCWFLDLNRIECSQFKLYVRDFHTMTKRQLLRNREKQTKMLFSVYNQAIFSSLFCEETFQIEWNKNLTTTAGRTNCISKKSIIKSPCSGKMRSRELERLANIELAPKILDSADRLRDTLVHEMCHAAVWLQTGDKSAGHGPAWKKWAMMVNSTFTFLPLVSRCHNYQINYKYWYHCTNCSVRIGRFSKSIKIEKQVCGRCHGKLELVNSNYVNNQSVGNIENLPSETGKDHLRGVVPLPQTPRTPNQYALFVKEKWSSVKKPGMTFAETHKEINRLYREKKREENYQPETID